MKVVSKLSNINNLRAAAPTNLLESVVSSPQQLMLNWNAKKEKDERERSDSPPLRQDYERQLKEFIDRNTVRATLLTWGLLRSLHEVCMRRLSMILAQTSSLWIT